LGQTLVHLTCALRRSTVGGLIEEVTLVGFVREQRAHLGQQQSHGEAEQGHQPYRKQQKPEASLTVVWRRLIVVRWFDWTARHQRGPSVSPHNNSLGSQPAEKVVSRGVNRRVSRGTSC
jgi:hypothetical protein